MDPNSNPDDTDDFNLDWESLTFSSPATGGEAWLASDEWEERLHEDATGYVANSLTTSFTDLDLSEARSDLRNTEEWADLDSWSDA